MRAMVIDAFGGPERFHPSDVPDLSPGPGQLLIKPEATSVNPIDTKIRSGAVTNLAPPFPAILHGDVAGTVAGVGPGVKGYREGDRVVGSCGGVRGHNGALAERTILDVRASTLLPPSIQDMTSAAAIPVACVTAWEALCRRVNVTPGMKVLVHAGCGGVGHIAVQIAAMRGAEVTTTVSSPEKAALAESFGAHHTVNYRREEVADYVGRLTGGTGFDVVVDTVGGAVLANSFAAARAGGQVVTIAARSTQDLTAVHGKGLTLHAVFLLLAFLGKTGFETYSDALPSIVGLVADGRLRLHIDARRFTFSGIGAAHALLEAGTAVGKIVATNDL